MNEVTERPFEPLTREYASANGKPMRTDTIYFVTWYTTGNELHQFPTKSLSLAEHMAFAKGGTYTTGGNDAK